MPMYSASAIKVFDVLTAARAAAQPLEHFKGLYFGEQEQNITRQKPAMLLKLDDPFISPDEEWVALKNKRGNFFRMVCVIISDATDSNFPYGKPGDATRRGLLTDMEAVMNVLDNAHQQFLDASPRNVDFRTTGRRAVNVGDRTFEAEIVLEFKQRVTLGGR